MVVAWEREGDVLQLAAHCSPSPRFPLRVLNFGNVPAKKGVKWCQTEAKKEKGEQQKQVILSYGSKLAGV